MSANYTIVLRECPPASRTGVAAFLGKAFSLKESTCTAIASSAPIILVAGLAKEEAAAMTLTLSGLQRLGGVLEFTTEDQGDLPKIDWPKRPLVFKREIAEHLDDLQTVVPGPDGHRIPLLTLLMNGLSSQTDTVDEDAEAENVGVEIMPAARQPTPIPAPVSAPTPLPRGSGPRPGTRQGPGERDQARGACRCPRSRRSPTPPSPRAPLRRPGSGPDDPAARLGELFPEEEQNGFVPNNEDITNLLDRLLPEDDAATRVSSSSGRSKTSPASAPGGVGGGFSVFLAKIADDARRVKATELIAELGKVTKEEADSLSKKVIIPVLKGVSKDEAEAAKQKFAKIGILARVKGPE